MDAVSAPAGRRRSWVGLLIPALIAFIVLIGLGTWQIQRKAWKEGLIAELNTQLAAPPIALPAPATWAGLDRAKDEYRRVTFGATFDNSKEALLFAAPSTFRPDADYPGYWVLTPARLADGKIVIVNRGFVPDGRQDPKTRAAGQIAGPLTIVGSMRWSGDRHWFTPADEPNKNLWFTDDPQSIAAAKGLTGVAPFYIEQESPVPPGGSAQARQAHGDAAGQSFAVRADLVRAGAGSCHHVCRLGLRPGPRRRWRTQRGRLAKACTHKSAMSAYRRS